jgi:hypothetical protein
VLTKHGKTNACGLHLFRRQLGISKFIVPSAQQRKYIDGFRTIQKQKFGMPMSALGSAVWVRAITPSEVLVRPRRAVENVGEI